MKKELNLIELVEGLKSFDKLEEIKSSGNYKRCEVFDDDSAAIVLWSPRLYMWYELHVKGAEAPYYLGDKAIPAGMATSFQRLLGWNVAKKMAINMVSKIENDAITWEEIVAMSKIEFSDNFEVLALRRAITKWLTRNYKLSGEVYINPNSHIWLEPARYDGSGKVVHSYSLGEEEDLLEKE